MLENRKALSEYRLQTAMEKVEAAKLLLDDGKHKDAANRAYYTMFHAVRAILALDGVAFKKHSGVISYFRQQYIATGIFVECGIKLFGGHSNLPFIVLHRFSAAHHFRHLHQVRRQAEQSLSRPYSAEN